MTKRPFAKVTHLRLHQPGQSMHDSLLGALPSGIIVVTRHYVIRYVNTAAEDFLEAGASALQGQELTHFIYPASRLMELIDAAFARKTLVREYDFVLSVQSGGNRTVHLQIQPLDEGLEAIIVIDDRGIAGALGQHLSRRESVRQTSGMASILAHEVKNPLSGIRGAAQLLQKTVSKEDRKLTALICNEVDRIRDVIDEIEIFSDLSALKVEPVNVHEVLQYVRLLAEKGFGTHVKFREYYDPSLPCVAGHRNLLIQMFLNIIKNSCEALEKYGEPCITLSSSYQSGFRFREAGEYLSRTLPIAVTIEDNGPGILREMQGSIFDPFVTTKEGGKGLGLAVVAKIIADHGGAIQLDNEFTAGTRIRILLPAA